MMTSIFSSVYLSLTFHEIEAHYNDFSAIMCEFSLMSTQVDGVTSQSGIVMASINELYVSHLLKT
jgi:hypothetical protein